MSYGLLPLLLCIFRFFPSLELCIFRNLKDEHRERAGTRIVDNRDTSILVPWRLGCPIGERQLTAESVPRRNTNNSPPKGLAYGTNCGNYPRWRGHIGCHAGVTTIAFHIHSTRHGRCDGPSPIMSRTSGMEPGDGQAGWSRNGAGANLRSRLDAETDHGKNSKKQNSKRKTLRNKR